MIIKDKNKLNKKCEPITSKEEGEEIVSQLFKQLAESKKGIGLAANQIGINKRACVVNVREPMYFINPKIVRTDKEVVGMPESCLSFPGKVVRTNRYRWVTVECDNLGTVVFGSDNDDEALLEAICVQHEIDHLDGITMFDKKIKGNTIKREGKKIGRNDKVLIASGVDSKVVKYKKALPLLEKGWTLVEP